MAAIGKVKDVMTKEVLAVDAEDNLETISQLFERYDYDGVPVVGAGRKLLGIITAYDMVVQSSGMHLPTVMSIMENISADKADQKDLESHFQKLREVKAKQIMNPEPLTVSPEASIEEAAKIFAEHHRVNPLVVVNGDGILEGVISRYDIIRCFNEKFFNQVVHNATTPQNNFKDSPTKGEKQIESAVGDISKEFLLVTKKRPRIWRYIAIGAFIAGLIGATALVIQIVKNGG